MQRPDLTVVISVSYWSVCHSAKVCKKEGGREEKKGGKQEEKEGYRKERETK